jgi:RNA polymerase sigma-70 factor (ECF subfamily)
MGTGDSEHTPRASELPADEGSTADLSIELVARARGGDMDAFGALYERYHDAFLFAVRVHLGAHLRTKLESEDILQSVVGDAIRALPAVRAETGEGLRHYLHAMIVNKIRSRAEHFGAQKRAGDVALSESVAGALADARSASEPRYHDGERYERLERALLALPEDMRQIVLLRRIDGLDSRAAAESLGRSEAATRKLYSRALARLTLTLGGAPRTEADGE